MGAYAYTGDALGAVAGSGGISVANAAALSAYDDSNLQSGATAHVATYRAVFYLDRVTTRTAVPDAVITALTPGHWWVRTDDADPYWALQTEWHIDPAGTHTTPGNDEASGLSADAPIKSVAEWRRRNRGAVITATVIIHPLSSSTVDDDGLFDGFKTDGTNGIVAIVGPTAVLFSGTITAYQAYSGNTRGSVTDSAIATSWTASGGIPTTVVGSRYIRKTGTSKMAPLLKDMGAKKAMIGLPVTISETSAATPSTAITDFQVGDAYQVVSRLRWPRIRANPNTIVRYVCIDVDGVIGGTGSVEFEAYSICGFLDFLTPYRGIAWACVFVDSLSTRAFTCSACAFLNTFVQMQFMAANWNGQQNVFVNSPVRVWHGGELASSGTLWCFDNTTECLSVRHSGSVNLQALVGDGNTGKLVLVEGGGTVNGGGTATATTSDGNPFTVSGVSGAAPAVNATTGDAIYT